MLKESQWIWMDGTLVPWKEANVHVLTHSLHYAMAVFEGIRAYDGPHGTHIFRLKEHTDRLINSGKVMHMPSPFGASELMEATVRTVAENGLTSCYIRPLMYIGYGDMGIYARQNPVRVSIAAWEWGTYLGEEGLSRGIRAKVSSYQRFGVNSFLNRAKVSAHYVNSQLAKWEVKMAGYDEAILLDHEGFVAEGPGENIFIVSDGVLRTPVLKTVLDGITRDAIMTLAREEGLTVSEEMITRDDLYLADEAFFTGTAAEITPIREIDERMIGTGKPGPVTLKLQKAFFDIVRGISPLHPEWRHPVKSSKGR
ncbi:MAG: Branched-chain amino acid aminotransferase [Leptospirillum sp. Group II 'C75']|uniref:Branched-chain-amino-acid aminotransferase n=1 Tax=Leptospirillum ferriphilum YSK TaxID=1441628 RepID=A0A059XXD3_9BACT|nr:MULTISPECIES: branched-chain amino acid transaminase [Leptospirillum]AIA29892.1 branched-chain amino acid aminotransferase [Leptospirillum ferriphilum YSK]AKS22581.1 branched-chain amino acid aminotransferase [Leptospirillum sp. Group II 'CF-1']EAY57905.1 MAG: Branched-chain amino acid aminotransferase [Leptospirillum rubarum]EIJ75938.1 MAG: Branched-chain amino acid aminotransferase [Leptospirillum sp. Group II 'C75']